MNPNPFSDKAKQLKEARDASNREIEEVLHKPSKLIVAEEYCLTCGKYISYTQDEQVTMAQGRQTIRRYCSKQCKKNRHKNKEQ